MEYLVYSLEYQRSIHAAEREIVVHDEFALQRAAGFGAIGVNIVELAAALVQIAQIQGGHEPIVTHHFNGEPAFDGAARAERMSQMTFWRADRNAAAEEPLRGLRLGNI